jgi:hypothetical protein
MEYFIKDGFVNLLNWVPMERSYCQTSFKGELLGQRLWLVKNLLT